MARCPRCGSADVRKTKTTLPSYNVGGSLRTVHEFRCRKCGLIEDAVKGELGFDEMSDRWLRAARSGGLS